MKKLIMKYFGVNMGKTELKNLIIELKKDITKIQHIMVEVSTRPDFSIQDCDEKYKDIHYSIETNLHKLKKYGIDMVHSNTYDSLWEFYTYWKSNLPTYQERREHIGSLYKNNLKQINKLLIEIDNEDIVPENINAEAYLEIENVPDDFYRQIIDLINECYNKGIYAAIPIFSRKLLESLIVDILKNKYGNNDVNIFFDTNNGKYHGFNKLLKAFENNLNDFKVDMPSLEKRFIREISKFREKGNMGAHVLELDFKKDKSTLDNDKDTLNHIVKILIRLEKNVTKI